MKLIFQRRGKLTRICGIAITAAICLTGACAIILYVSGALRRDKDAYGRTFLRYDSPRCCFTSDCLTATHEGTRARTGVYPSKHAFVTSLRSAHYMVLLRELHCSLSATNPGIPLVVLAVANELSSEIIEEVSSFAQHREVPNIEYPSKEPRFGKNWFKMNAWNFTEYESLILLDSDMVVLGDLRHVFDLPTDFAWTYLNAPDGYAYNIGGLIMIRPCAAVFTHMLQIVEQEESKRYKSKFAEQSFFAWYFAYTGYRLPMTYNANFHFLINGTTIGGAKPLVVHFATVKPFSVEERDDAWEYMCFRYQERTRRMSRHFFVGGP